MNAEALRGNGDRAFQYYQQINPATKNDSIDTFECEPYAYPQNILGDEHPQFGLGRNSWLSGTAAWTYTAATKFILGLMPVHAGLRISPCIPKSWDGFEVQRQFRGASYDIVIKNPKHVARGVVKLVVNGVELKGDVVPPAKPGAKVKVEVTLG
jgi:cellobiose phosphorylase